MELTLNGRVTFNQEQVATGCIPYLGTVTEVRGNERCTQKVRFWAVIRKWKWPTMRNSRKMLPNKCLPPGVPWMRLRTCMFWHSSERDMLQAKQELAAAEAEDKRAKEVFHLSSVGTPLSWKPRSGIYCLNKNISKDMQIRSDQSEELFTIGVGTSVMADALRK